MSCFFNNRCCRNVSWQWPMVAVGPTGATGPAGPQGPTGPAGPIGITETRIASFNNNTGNQVASNTDIPLTDGYNLSQGSIDHTADTATINLVDAGYYKVSYGADIPLGSTRTISMGATLNGSAVPTASSVGAGNSGDTTKLGSEFIVQATENATLTIKNTSGDSITPTYVYVTVQYLG